MHRELRRPMAICQLAVSVLLWSLTGPIVKEHPWDGYSLGFGRGSVAALIMLIALNKRLCRTGWLDVVIGAGFALNSVGFILACKWGSVANAIVLVYAAPIYSALFATFIRKEKLPWYYWPSLAIVLAGIVLMFMDDLQTMNFRATAAGLVSGLSLTVWIECRRFAGRDGGDRGLFFGALIAVVFLSPWFVTACNDGLEFTAPALLVIVGYASMIVVAYLFFSRVVETVSGPTALLITGAEVPLMVLWVYLVSGELPAGKALIGGILIFAVTIFMGWKTAMKTEAESPL